MDTGKIYTIMGGGICLKLMRKVCKNQDPENLGVNVKLENCEAQIAQNSRTHCIYKHTHKLNNIILCGLLTSSLVH